MRYIRAAALAGITMGMIAVCPAGALVAGQPFEAGKGNLRAGPVRVHPFVSIGELYDDNIFLQPHVKKDDFVTVISPGVVFRLPFGRHELMVGYRADLLRFAELQEEDHERHTGLARLTGKYAGGLSWYVEDEAQRTNERPDTEIEPFIDRDQNDGRIGAEYKFADRWSVGADYANRLYDYENLAPALPGGPTRNYGRELDRMEQLGTVTLYYLIQPKTALLAEFGQGETSYFSSQTAARRDNVIRLGRVGVRGDLTAKLSALVRVGYGVKDFDDPARGDFDGLVASGSMAYRYSDFTRLSLTVERSAPEASYLAQGDQFFTNQSLTLRADHYFSEKIRAHAEGSLANHDYDGGRDDDLYGAAIGLRYYMTRYVTVGADYVYERRDSAGTPGSDFDYTDNQVLLKAGVAL